MQKKGDIPLILKKGTFRFSGCPEKRNVPFFRISGMSPDYYA